MAPRSLEIALRTTGKRLVTPVALVASRNGAVPHLTRETLDVLFNGLGLDEDEKVAFSVPLNAVVRLEDVLGNFDSVGRFMGLDEAKSAVALTPFDVCDLEPRTGFHQNKSVSVFSYGNREAVDPKRFCDIVEASKPDIVIPICDGETPRDASNKRLSKAVSRSLTFLDDCLKRLRGRFVLGAVQGGYNAASRRISATETAKRNVDGFVIDGFEAGDFDLDLVKKSVLPQLMPETKPRYAPGPLTPSLILDLIDAGVDIFDTSICFKATESGMALTFPFEEDEKGAFQIDLNKSEFKEDFTPISTTCSCYTCEKHTKAYINHLLKTKELLAPVLLTIHNLHHFLTFISAIRRRVRNGESLAGMKKTLASCF